MDFEYKVSVIVPVYNAYDYLRTSMDCLINQTLEDLQIICINDGSTDKSLEILNEYRDKYKNVEVYTIENSGASVARNFGITKVRGKYLGFMDADDEIPKHYFEALYNAINVTSNDIIMTNFTYHIGQHKPIEMNNKLMGIFDKFDDMLRLLTNGAVWNKLFLFDIIKNNNISFYEGVMWEDNLFVIQAYHYAKSLKIVNFPTYRYIKRINSVTFNENIEEKRLKDAKFIYNKIMEYAEENNYSKDTVLLIEEFCKERAMKGFLDE